MRETPFSFLASVACIPGAGKHFSVAPTQDECRAVAQAVGVVDVEKLTAKIDVLPLAGATFAVRGTLAASVVQIDVVTLEPVRQDMSEAIDLTLQPAEDAATKNRISSAGPDVSEDLDVYRGGRIDLGAIMVEHLALGLDPYPRSPGVEFPGHIEVDPAANSSPFAALAKLKPERD